ncbi:hypothetical protein [Xanthocytophaga agilis]|uniref:Uncharacterized protein n=1 Tax=Xanthocytophaga agilis TaxID=3048010 RepID=A0AAE3R031_9BACT|nr:hypothetical protein [Xanthocytophaga agilis]MDJ1500660.1 hypothetical protein [Xanthocytophaga agilis]
MSIAELIDAEYQQTQTTRMAQSLFDIISDTQYEMEDVLIMQVEEFEQNFNIKMVNG